ncbi:hypothetical protein LCGC14_0620570 [marine sediment metagenome]|uniref:Uncharacterized protein n=1 Tax=marine sediment metagenome TaxID=412755 RepID=A0A0F9R9X5_9ZZZZ
MLTKLMIGMLVISIILIIFGAWTLAQPPAYSEVDFLFMKIHLQTICEVRMDVSREECKEMFDDITSHMPDETWDCYEPYRDDWTDLQNGMEIIYCIVEEM